MVARPLSLARLGLEDDYAQRRQGQQQRVEPAVRGQRIRLYPTEIAHAAAAVDRGVAVEELAPVTAARNADGVVLARNRREVAHHQHLGAVARLAQEADDARFDVASVYPFEAARGKVELVQRRLAAMDAVEVAYPALHARMLRVRAEVPVEAHIVVPLAPLRELAAHEQQLLAGMRPHVAVEQAQVGELLPPVARHFGAQRALAVDDLIMR